MDRNFVLPVCNRRLSDLAKPIEAFLKSMHGVLSSRVVQSDSGEPEQVFVLVDGSVPHAPSYRDIQSALLLQYDLHLPAERFFVIRLPSRKDMEEGIGRFQLLGVSSSTVAHEAVVQVQLRLEQKLALGSSRGPFSPNMRSRLAAQATLAAVDEAVGFPLGFKFIDLAQITLGGKDCITSMVYLKRPHKELRLVGTALVENDPETAAAKSVLDAINRNLDHYALLQEARERYGDGPRKQTG